MYQHIVYLLIFNVLNYLLGKVNVITLVKD